MRTNLSLGLLVGLSLMTATFAAAFPGPATSQYDGPGVVVSEVNAEGQPLTLTDTGAVVCEDTDADGIPDEGKGGACIPFDSLRDPDGFFFQDSIQVKDGNVPDHELAFQACVDVNGDNKCTFGGGDEGGSQKGPCGDIIRFSHDSKTGAVHNPLFVDPVNAFEAFDDCNSSGFPGYVVMLCAGAHVHANDPTTSHSHEATKGSVQSTLTGGTGQGDFCGAPQQEKVYEVI